MTYFYQKTQNMKLQLPATASRYLLVALLATSGLFTAACKKDELSDEDQIKKYISDNKITNAKRQPSGLYYVSVTADTSKVRATAGRTVSVLYTGALMDGSVFDASSKRGNVPISFILGAGRVIKGWDEGIALMRKGEKAQLLIPSALGYGSSGAGSSIPPNAVLRFDVELTDVK